MNAIVLVGDYVYFPSSIGACPREWIGIGERRHTCQPSGVHHMSIQSHDPKYQNDAPSNTSQTAGHQRNQPHASSLTRAVCESVAERGVDDAQEDALGKA